MRKLVGNNYYDCNIIVDENRDEQQSYWDESEECSQACITCTITMVNASRKDVWSASQVTGS